MAGLEQRFIEGLTESSLLPKRRSIVVAVSGGLDSVLLLHLLSRCSETFGWSLVVAHFNHRLRGRASGGDERFVRSLAAQLGCRFHSARWEESAQRKAVKKYGVERAAREARRAFLGEIARETRSKHVVYAHHADDQVELFFIRLFRGAGSRGLAGMQKSSKANLPTPVTLVRPLLDFSRAELENWASENKIRFREDASNQDQRFLRNRIRRRLLPELDAEFSTGLREKVVQTMSVLAEESAWCRLEARRALESSTGVFGEMPLALQRQMILLQLEELGVEFDYETVERLRKTEGSIVNLVGDRFVSRDNSGRLIERDNSTVSFVDSVHEVRLRGASGRTAFGGISLKWRLCRAMNGQVLSSHAERELFDADSVGDEVTLRHWRPGDRFRPIGMSRPVKLQDLFTNAKIPAEVRRKLVVAESRLGGVFWVEGLRIGEIAKVTADSRNYLEWRWIRQE